MIAWSKFPSKIRDVEVMQNLSSRKQIWRLRYQYMGREIISKWREDTPPMSELELETKMKMKPVYYNGGQ